MEAGNIQVIADISNQLMLSLPRARTNIIDFLFYHYYIWVIQKDF